MEETEILGLRQKEWGWKVAAYLFLAGVGAGAYAIGAAIDLLGMSTGGVGREHGTMYAANQLNQLSGEGWATVSRVGIALGFPLLLVGTMFLIADLGVKPRALRVFLNPGTSWIARGSIIISTFMVLGAIHIFAWLWPFRWLNDAVRLRMFLEGVNFIFAILTMIYTGVLLGASRVIPLWSTATLPFLFLVSALSTGVMTLVLLVSLFARGTVAEAVFPSLAKLDILLIAIESVVLAFYLQATHRTIESRASAAILTKGDLAPTFWIGVALAGLLVPVVIEIGELTYFSQYPSSAGYLLLTVGMLLGLTGGYLLRLVVLAGGVKAPISAAGFQFAVPVTPHKS